ncbi:hypothetical protein [Micromonospora sp. ATCC 39149]|uniref:hypothetical protein n=1 Tax=Micromonospora sp. (strain ATCC 39149 / NRRL 15099 / SCC 1413) TaxID=219305 RepID=UPI00068229A9|nr:hypothetical protein [Micromonospora sp. ATCC 39149]
MTDMRVLPARVVNGSRAAVRKAVASSPAAEAGNGAVPATNRPVAESSQHRTPRSAATAGSRSGSRAPAAIAATTPRCRPSIVASPVARCFHTDGARASMTSRKDTSTGISNRGTPCRRQASTRSDGTPPEGSVVPRRSR